MATPPRPTPEEVAAAMENIARRHRKQGDDHPLLYSNDPLEVLAYLRRCRNEDFLEDEHGHDIEDALVLRLWLWWEGEAIELRLLDAAEELGLNRRRIGRLLGIKTGQGLVDRRDRKRMMLGYEGVPDEKIARAARRAAQQTVPQDVEYVRTLRAFVELLVENRDLLPDDIVTDLAALEPELSPPYPDAPLSPAFVAQLRLTVRELQEHPLDGTVAVALRYVRPLLDPQQKPAKQKKSI